MYAFNTFNFYQNQSSFYIFCLEMDDTQLPKGIEIMELSTEDEFDEM